MSELTAFIMKLIVTVMVAAAVSLAMHAAQAGAPSEPATLPSPSAEGPENSPVSLFSG